jgi:cbb3-type cytochrome c oxidase subunit III
MHRRLAFLVLAALVSACFALLHGPGTSRAASAAAASAATLDGKAIFAAKCSACHQGTGLGAGPYPPLAANPDVTAADTANLIGTILNGRSGPIVVLGKTYSGTMPAWRGQLSSSEIAAVATYVRSAWGNAAAAVSEDQVAALLHPQALSGAQIFAAKCAACHQADGKGNATYPPLAGNPHVVAPDPKGMIATIVNGKSGALSVNGANYAATMPTWKGQLSNADIAIVATYVRSAWGNSAPAVSEQEVAAAGSAVASAVGQSVYGSKCVSCHRANGQGTPGVFPALAGNKDVNAPDPAGMLATISNGRNAMPSWKGQLSPGDIAAVATYIRSAWGNKGGAVSEADVAAVK